MMKFLPHCRISFRVVSTENTVTRRDYCNCKDLNSFCPPFMLLLMKLYDTNIIIKMLKK